MSDSAAITAEPLLQTAPRLRCVFCPGGPAVGDECPECGRSYPERGGIVEAIGTLTGTNRIAAAFYDGPNWPRFRPWEQLFLWFQGPGVSNARGQVLRHLPRRPRARVLEVGIGDGENLGLLPRGWEVFGVDIARTQLEACVARHPAQAGRLFWAEAECLPFDDHSFDAVFTIGGFNYFRDPAAALREMRRVARPEAPVVVADELPDLYRFAPGYALGLEGIDRLGLRLLGLDPEFIAMVFGHRLDVDALAREVYPGHRRFAIWNRLGYCLVDPASTLRGGLERWY